MTRITGMERILIDADNYAPEDAAEAAWEARNQPTGGRCPGCRLYIRYDNPVTHCPRCGVDLACEPEWNVDSGYNPEIFGE